MSNDKKLEGKYNIKAVSTILGIQPGTLRAWERRYQIIAPVRNESGHRLYTEQHLNILKWLVEKVDQGFTISQAVALLDKQELEENEITSSEQKDRTQTISDDLLKALLSFDETKAHELINQSFSVYTIDKVVIDILGSLLVRIGDLWENDEITTAHEHFATSILRSRIGIIMHSFPHNGILPKVVAVCGPGEWHELGLLIFTLYVRRKGFEVIYLGSSIKENDIEVVLDEVDPKFLFFSCTLFENVDNLLSLVTSLKTERKDLVIGMGGFAVDHLPKDVKAEFDEHIVGQSKSEWEHWLKSKL
ncbi:MULTISPECIES: MerR family transcriptional regulator [Rossellomorea]|uniref:MerR family transcriptional regulator n=1 Tax=Rossellomorea vietnamensis TaxID=218284 RepID=A0A6I6UL71_9BACI|nr:MULTISPECIES: MerR family transcriptional regulator [Rossellomorea]OXS58656.1 MerR family transcriptional regulator [Bacillus sp. DSM 27956]PRX75564.1 DNA-binding transcriptional MerR regulator [Bacillus sp. V-88]MCA0147782.1 MerR family transcriptional regulator [Rossellomorea vietnamensis]MCC5800370.1 MerR family transcriptional regulator [Rossellomorea vietnamensis]QHE62027.1 MerR family transcriptional regulator [Rossellomorea vietnamensis]